MSSSEIHFGTLPITVHCFFCLHMNYKIIDSTQKKIHETFYLKAGMAWDLIPSKDICTLQYYGKIYPAEKHQNPTNSTTLFNDE